ncbi:putative transcriptional acitvator, Baf family [Denitrovibrio acetiphilus DSM 12809]|uniref:Type III pantothenate kinase n=1 Tax=Denitrovibrio acetiphilus (strain DSM 12809 / NBRC 114555 / N2460) TaxID=522772 RepID=D4H7L3_DENA2|nr:type III pantothenate kinase [Denitrovibrio acetiphilus]ADD68012.1 putative transcriptional acitvator, Baf family [Denitrovibrio acetiphilus DSM 12809]
MIFAVDIGNTNVVIGVFDGDKIKTSYRVQADTMRTTDEYASTLLRLMESEGISKSDITGVIISSVVPRLIYTFSKLSKKYLNKEPLVIAPGIKTGVSIKMENPKEVGADRIVNAVAAKQLYGYPAIVVDFGTATTFDVIDSNGDYIGGVICPGVKLSSQILHSNTAKLPEVEIEKVNTVIGKNTIHSIQSGIYYGYLAMLDGILERIIAEEFKGMDVNVISTGGLGSIFTGECAYIQSYAPNLTLDGLRLIYEKNLI